MSFVQRLRRRWLALERRVLLALHAWTIRSGRRTLPRHLEVGERGELEAYFFLRGLGYRIVERRWHSPDWNGDLDLIGWDGGRLAIVEVKTRSARTLTPAAASVDSTKRRLLRGMAFAYRARLPGAFEERIPLRFDLVSVYLAGGRGECELLRGIDVG